jgi:hypothetical protein
MKGGETMKSKPMSASKAFEKKDKAADRKQGIKENSPKDKKMDKKKK